MPDPAELEALKDACTAANLSSRVHQADLASRAMLNAVLEQIPTVSFARKWSHAATSTRIQYPGHPGVPDVCKLPTGYARAYMSSCELE